MSEPQIARSWYMATMLRFLSDSLSVIHEVEELFLNFLSSLD